jgi:xanthine dehydrogenase accessory factor
MKELRTILTEFDKIDFSKRKAAMATVVKVAGSSYRSPGARMLITDDGRWVGSISGGCLEGDALRKARLVMESGKALTVTYDTREESNQKLGIGLGCNGVIDVLIEAVTPTISDNIAMLKSIVANNRTVALATVIRPEANAGKKMLIEENQKELNHLEDEVLSQRIRSDLRAAFETQRSEAKMYSHQDDWTEVFIEVIQPSISLLIFGAGFDARPVSQIANSLGWEVTVTDECVAHIAPLYFPTADKLSLCNRSFIDRDFKIDAYTACILMSHNYEYDRDVLRKVIKTNTGYIGILGPRKRFDKMLAEFKNEGFNLANGELERIHSPIGLDIGAETPDEIAISIIAEIQSKFSGRSGGFLKYRTTPIHTRHHKSDEVFKQVYLAGDQLKKASNC